MTQPLPRLLSSYRYSLLFVMACSAGVDDPNASCSQELREKLEWDCQQTIACKVQRAEPQVNQSVDQCADASSQRLRTAPERNQFLINHGRCRALVAPCDYIACAGTGAHGFGETQTASITNYCQQISACNTARGAQACDSALAVADCVAFTTGQLDSLSSSQQPNYQAAITRCAGLTSCEFVTCVQQ